MGNRLLTQISLSSGAMDRENRDVVQNYCKTLANKGLKHKTKQDSKQKARRKHNERSNLVISRWLTKHDITMPLIL